MEVTGEGAQDCEGPEGCPWRSIDQKSIFSRARLEVIKSDKEKGEQSSCVSVTWSLWSVQR